jgi:hypothetical protein
VLLPLFLLLCPSFFSFFFPFQHSLSHHTQITSSCSSSTGSATSSPPSVSSSLKHASLTQQPALLTPFGLLQSQEHNYYSSLVESMRGLQSNTLASRKPSLSGLGLITFSDYEKGLSMRTLIRE